jgi:hypothetical protein
MKPLSYVLKCKKLIPAALSTKCFFGLLMLAFCRLSTAQVFTQQFSGTITSGYVPPSNPVNSFFAAPAGSIVTGTLVVDLSSFSGTPYFSGSIYNPVLPNDSIFVATSTTGTVAIPLNLSQQINSINLSLGKLCAGL